MVALMAGSSDSRSENKALTAAVYRTPMFIGVFVAFVEVGALAVRCSVIFLGAVHFENVVI